MKLLKKQIKPIADVGKGLASIADVALGAIPAVVGGATYAGARAFQKSSRRSSSFGTKSICSIRKPYWKSLGITEDPAYKQEAVRRAMDSIGQYIGKVQILFLKRLVFLSLT